jgi:hypothetical protein
MYRKFDVTRNLFLHSTFFSEEVNTAKGRGAGTPLSELILRLKIILFNSLA